jgi:enamine deaminase RidA (YjgF/YER057c/UK114 family)
MSAEAKLQAMNLELPPAPKPAGVYKPVLVVGDLVYVSGHGPLRSDGTLISGRVGADLDQQAGYDAARQTGLAIVATLRANFGDLDKIERIVKTLGMVNATPDFTAHPSVINGFSDLFRELYGPESGVGARSAVGMGSLPGNIAVEVEAIFQLKSS